MVPSSVTVVTCENQDSVAGFGQPYRASTVSDSPVEGWVHTEAVLHREGCCTSDVATHRSVARNTCKRTGTTIEIEDAVLVYIQNKITQEGIHASRTRGVSECGACVSKSKRTVLHTQHRQSHGSSGQRIGRSGDQQGTRAGFVEMRRSDAAGEFRNARLSITNIDDAFSGVRSPCRNAPVRRQWGRLRR